MFYIVATPIGNLKDITLRAIEVLQSVDLVVCEDTRRTSILLQHYQIKKTLKVVNDFNEASQVASIINLLQQGQNIALVSDAGTPLISDPGFKLVRTVIEQKLPFQIIPGVSALTSALPISQMPTDKFTFLGYLPEKPLARLSMLKKLVEISKLLPTTFIVYVAPHKLVKTLQEYQEAYGDIQVSLVHEITKLNESADKQLISSWLTKFNQQKARGEWVLLFNLGNL
ncbi:16S rRNA (cytidine(1402)-2'-O)-methyltransferase [Patescibacteria group bacterium]|nr:16S rRNA (cytidine(1402)-2'-O)-methyltransferase [Patescibacteria group bacterium]MCL5409602.1 16S rRNA (cytidine(1402)-2'-O)-methyltransferase [Patescibacteria group bacterium]